VDTEKIEQQLQSSDNKAEHVKLLAEASRKLSEDVCRRVQSIADMRKPQVVESDLIPYCNSNPLVTPEMLGYLLDASPVLVVELAPGVTDPMILRATRIMERVFGYLPGELDGKPISTLIPEASRESHQVHLARFIEDPSDRHIGELGDLVCPQGVRKNGEIIDLEIALTVFVLRQRMFGVATIMPQVRHAKT
jgi:hypothetical protein